jgi:hypothetical protein
MSHRPFPLLDSLKVEPLPDDLVAVTVQLPTSLVKDYCQFLEALAGFFHTAHRKSELAHLQQRSADQELDDLAQSNIAAYQQRVAALFDRYTAEGLNRKQAIIRISGDLRAEHHPWHYVEQIQATLVESGRPGRRGRPRKVQP